MKEIKIEVKQHPGKDVFLIKLSPFPETILEVCGLYAVALLGSNEKVMNMTPLDYLTLSANRHRFERDMNAPLPIVEHRASNFDDVSKLTAVKGW